MRYALVDESGDLKTGTVLSEADASVQIELDSGRRAKLKANQVFLRFDAPTSRELLPAAQVLADQMDLEFLWECAPKAEFGFADLAQDYFSGSPSPVESAAVLMRLQSAPIYFQRKGKGRFFPAPREIITQALAAVEKRKALEQQVQDWADQMLAGVLPESVGKQASRLLTRPDKMSLEYKAVDLALRQAHATGQSASPEHFLLKLGAFESEHHLHLDLFCLEHFPKGLGFASELSQAPASKRVVKDAPAPAPAPSGKNVGGLGGLAGLGALKTLVKPVQKPLEKAAAQAFSIDDSTTTEIDDCLSVQSLPDGRHCVGIHIAAPGFGIEHDSALDQAARERMSTVYMPGQKITMMPESVVGQYSLDAGKEVPVLSLYADLDANGTQIVSVRSVVEQMTVWANLRHDQLDDIVTEEALQAPSESHASFEALPQAQALRVLWKLTLALGAQRDQVRGKPEARFRTDFNFYVDDFGGAQEKVRIVQRRRDAPLDRIVAEMMILANSEWGKVLADAQTPGLYRSQQAGRVRMTTHALPHEGLGVAQYMWSTSPLRRYVDLVNQRQLISVLRFGIAPYAPRDPKLFAILSGFDAKYTAYGDIQDRMERYWCLRWVQQQAPIRRFAAVVIRDETVRLADAPLFFRLTGLPGLAPGRRIEVEMLREDLVDLSVEARFVQTLEGEVVVAEPEEKLPAELEAPEAAT